MNRARILLIALAALPAAMAAAAPAGAYDPLTWWSIDGGGGAFATGGGWRLGGTIGQPDAGTLGGGAYTLRGGFWIGGGGGLVGVEENPPLVRSFLFLPTRPNPVRSRSRIVFDLPRASRVTLSVFDVSGRAVRRWDYGLLPPGRQERTWDAADDRGRQLPSGVYFLRLVADRDQGVHKVLVVR